MDSFSNEQAESVKNRRALLLVSGGPDSKTLARVAQHEGANLAAAVYLRTGQPSDDKEIAAAQKVAKQLGIPLQVIDITNAVESLDVLRLMPHAKGPVAQFGIVLSLSIAIQYAQKVRAEIVLIGLHADDARENSQYGQPFLDQINVLTNTAGVATVVAPLLNLSKTEVFDLGISLGVDYADTWSCYERGDIHCGTCGACLARQKAFSRLEIDDPTTYFKTNKSVDNVAGVLVAA